MSDERSQSYICAIVPPGQKGLRPRVIGMGILVSRSEILTCAHVIDAALGERWQEGDGKVRVCFPFYGGRSEGFLTLDGIVDRTRWSPPGQPEPNKLTDIAVIRLPTVPASVKPAVLEKHTKDDVATIFGYREIGPPSGPASHPEGEHLEGKILGSLPGGRGQFEGTSQMGATVQRGFSGSGVQRGKRNIVVGMIVEADRDPSKKIAQFIDVPSLQRALGRKRTDLYIWAAAILVMIAIASGYHYRLLHKSPTQRTNPIDKSAKLIVPHPDQTARKHNAELPTTSTTSAKPQSSAGPRRVHSCAEDPALGQSIQELTAKIQPDTKTVQQLSVFYIGKADADFGETSDQWSWKHDRLVSPQFSSVVVQAVTEHTTPTVRLVFQCENNHWVFKKGLSVVQ
ncbi:MAG: trypsin-like peptidase domain-containing protein [Bryobacteraceae bacterium]